MAMAEQDNELYLRICRLQELFKGRYSVEEVATILEHNDGQLDRSVTFILSNEPDVIRHILQTEKNSWTTIETKTRRIKNEHKNNMTRPSIIERAKSGKIDTNCRLFACKPCDFSWWRRTPERKQVSRCKRCRVRYNPVPREREWGWAEFKCPHPGCGRDFGGWCAMNQTSKCYGCGRPLLPSRILPPDKQKHKNRKNMHSCDAPDCQNRAPGGGGGRGGHFNHYGSCVHPGSRTTRGLPKVITPSEPHDSTGSTVETFLDQDDLTKAQECFYPTLAAVQEEDRDSLSGNPGSEGGDLSDSGEGAGDQGAAAPADPAQPMQNPGQGPNES